MNNVEMKVVSILKEYSDKKDLSGAQILNNDFRGLGVNSLNFIKIVVAIEEEFDIVFDDSQINYELFGNVQDIVSLVEKELNNKEE
ncbi:acyl carrier protein [Ruminiclostridium josui]|uniref:acyl carrier protein n=1 Tax=Ruminiclostridium josui TaxID=1499 RepID=UPI0004653C6A|nr:phosphopantetheine-binding protein [Ruminiclostridium josui]